jgi:predicted DNA-binding protein
MIVNNKPKRKTSVQFSEEDYTRLGNIAKRRRISISQVVQEAVNDYLDKQIGMEKKIKELEERIKALEEKVK